MLEHPRIFIRRLIPTENLVVNATLDLGKVVRPKENLRINSLCFI